MKAIGWIVGILVLLVLGVGAYVVMNSGNFLKTAIETFGPEYLGTSVTVEEVDLSLQSGSLAVGGFAIGQPAGFESSLGSEAMRLGLTRATLDTSQTGGNLVVLKEMVIDGAELVAVARGKAINLQQLVDNLEQASGPEETTEASAAADEEEMTFIIEKFDFTNTKVALDSDLVGEHALTIPDLHLTDIGRASNGATAAEVLKQVMRPITKSVSEEVVKKGLDVDGIKAQAEEQIRDKISTGLKGILNRE